MRKLITAFKMSLDGKIEGAEGYADWVAAWSEDFGLMQQIDACVVGGGMYPGYEKYWSAIQNAGNQPLPMTGKFPSSEEIKWGCFAERTPHYVLSTKLASAQWPRTSFLRSLDELAALKKGRGKDIYLMGGARAASALMDAGLVDELRLIIYPLVAGPGKQLFATTVRRQRLQFHKAQELSDGLISLIYGIG